MITLHNWYRSSGEQQSCLNLGNNQLQVASATIQYIECNKKHVKRNTFCVASRVFSTLSMYVQKGKNKNKNIKQIK